MKRYSRQLITELTKKTKLTKTTKLAETIELIVSTENRTKIALIKNVFRRSIIMKSLFEQRSSGFEL